MKSLTAVVLFIVLCITNHHALAQPDTTQLKQQYLEAVENAAVPTAAKQYNGLVSITDSNQNLQDTMICGERYILVATWKGNTSYFPKQGKYNTSYWDNLWISVSPQLWDRFHALNPADTNMRLLQLLGLPPTSVYKGFVTFWVKPSDLARPCPDPEITDTECSLCFPADVQKNDPDWISWINASRLSRYYPCDPMTKYPWTQLGYTYDWNPKVKDHVGVSEFIVRKYADVYIRKIFTTAEYLGSNRGK